MAPARTLVVDHRRERPRWSAADAQRRASHKAAGGRPRKSPLTEVRQFGANPGALKMLAYAPAGLPDRSPLVVVLHGCSQDARGYDAHAGWTALADERGFAVLYPEQSVANNSGGCFNWFLPADASRGLGETRSIREMVETMIKQHHVGRERIFVTGLSAGGAMAAALLADYPEIFSAGAVVAGLPCGAATNVQEAFREMSGPRGRTPKDLGELVRAGSPNEGSWPRVAILHGSADKTVAPKNADELAKQWVDVHGAALGGFREDFVDGHRRRVWTVGGRDVVEQVTVEGMGHGLPLDSRVGERKGPFMLDVGLSSTRRIADFFGIERPQAACDDEVLEPVAGSKARRRAAAEDSAADAPTARDDIQSGRGRHDIGAVIAKALKSFGLMK